MNNDTTDQADWRPYIYKGLPVELNRRPPQIAPYQLRLDWQMWFASMYTPDDYPWTFNLVWKLLHHDKRTEGLFKRVPFPGQSPKFIRAVLYRYRFAREQMWTRERVGMWIRPMSVDDQELKGVLTSMGFPLSP
jgi:hypothetical protein